MIEDVVKELGFLTLGTRFKRIGEALQAQTAAGFFRWGPRDKKCQGSCQEID